MSHQEADYEKVKVFRETYKDLESVYDMFPKLCGLSGTEYWALSMIHEGISTQHEICEHLSMSRQTLNSAFRQLKKRGLIYLETLDTNLREKQVYLTEVGKDFIEKEISHIHQLEEDVWNQLSQDEKRQMTQLLEKYKSLLFDAIENYNKQ